MSDVLNVSVADGKYRVIMKESGELTALRYEEEWRDCCGDNLIYNLAAELQEAKERIGILHDIVVKAFEIL